MLLKRLYSIKVSYRSLCSWYTVVNTWNYASLFRYRFKTKSSLLFIYLNLFQNFKFGVLLTTCKSPDGTVFCVMQGFQPCCSSGVPLVTHHDCPIFELSKTIFITEATNILKAVLFVHLCAGSCKFEETSTPVLLEQEEVDTTGLQFVHDYKNYM